MDALMFHICLSGTRRWIFCHLDKGNFHKRVHGEDLWQPTTQIHYSPTADAVMDNKRKRIPWNNLFVLFVWRKLLLDKTLILCLGLYQYRRSGTCYRARHVMSARASFFKHGQPSCRLPGQHVLKYVDGTLLFYWQKEIPFFDL